MCALRPQLREPHSVSVTCTGRVCVAYRSCTGRVQAFYTQTLDNVRIFGPQISNPKTTLPSSLVVLPHPPDKYLSLLFGRSQRVVYATLYARLSHTPNVYLSSLSSSYTPNTLHLTYTPNILRLLIYLPFTPSRTLLLVRDILRLAYTCTYTSTSPPLFTLSCTLTLYVEVYARSIRLSVFFVCLLYLRLVYA